MKVDAEKICNESNHTKVAFNKNCLYLSVTDKFLLNKKG